MRNSYPEIHALSHHKLHVNRESSVRATEKQASHLCDLVKKAGIADVQFIRQGIVEGQLQPDCANCTKLDDLSNPEVGALFAFASLVRDQSTRPEPTVTRAGRRSGRQDF